MLQLVTLRLFFFSSIKHRKPDIKAVKASIRDKQYAADFNLMFQNVPDIQSHQESNFELDRLHTAVREGHLGVNSLEAKSVVFLGISETAHGRKLMK